MRGKLFIQALGSFQIAQTVLLLSPAFSAIGGDFTPQSVRQERRAATVKVAGTLSCNMGEQNTSQPCELKLQDQQTGKVYRLSTAGEAMRMFHSGSKTISVEGTFTDAETIQVNRVEKL